ncbi:MAG TPA: SPOR domain-containing protein, partial [Anaeromyxobacter sp.]
MRDPNPRLRPSRERFELSLDGRQVASIVAGALVLLAVVFVLGLKVGEQIALRRAEREPGGDLDALDRAPAPPAPVKDEALTFHDRLTKD